MQIRVTACSNTLAPTNERRAVVSHARHSVCVRDPCDTALKTRKSSNFVLLFKPYAVDGHLEKLDVNFEPSMFHGFLVISNLRFLKFCVLLVQPIQLFLCRHPNNTKRIFKVYETVVAAVKFSYF